ncbi:uncharacterized protein LOC125490149 [Plutella xylostella]|uniref:uncharacterized protein LOC125490149 n=1 Tax=Plutella xylostella TaxID=51655 RepID=UPI002032C28D|nr:uncharacterized protein LOC125490149 [Plutella xylostella]
MSMEDLILDVAKLATDGDDPNVPPLVTGVAENPADQIAPEGAGDNQREQVSTRRPARSGAARRRLRMWLAKGKSIEEAKALCLRPLAQTESELEVEATPTQASKRTRSEEQTPPNPPRKQPRCDGTPEDRPTYSAAASSLKVGVRDERRALSIEDVAFFNAAIERELYVTDFAPGTAPVFGGVSYADGLIIVTCLNQASRDWLCGCSGRLRPWAGAALKTVEGQALPRPVIATAFFKSLAEPKVLLDLLRKQNEGLDCSTWRVLGRRLEKNGQHLTFSVSKASYEVLKAVKFRPNCGTAGAVFRVRVPKGAAAVEQPTAQTTLPAAYCQARPDGPVEAESRGGSSAAPAVEPVAGPSGISTHRPGPSRAPPAGGAAPRGGKPARPGARKAPAPRGRAAGAAAGVRRPTQLPSLAKEHSSKKASRNPLNNPP